LINGNGKQEKETGDRQITHALLSFSETGWGEGMRYFANFYTRTVAAADMEAEGARGWAERAFLGLVLFLVTVAPAGARQQCPPDATRDESGGPWFNTLQCHLVQTPTVAAFNSLVVGSDAKMVRCRLVVTVCGTTMKREKDIPAARGQCPRAGDIAVRPVCCDRWNAARRSNQPCNPADDADCDGIPNGQDDDPLHGPGAACPGMPDLLRDAFDAAFAKRRVRTPPCYTDVQQTSPGSMKFQTPLSATNGLLPTADWVNDQFEHHGLRTPQEAGHYMLVGYVQYVDDTFRVMMRIDSLETGEVLKTGKGDGTGCPDGLATAVDSALANLGADIGSYTARP